MTYFNRSGKSKVAFGQMLPLSGVWLSFRLLLEIAKQLVGLTKMQLLSFCPKWKLNRNTPSMGLVLVQLVLGTRPQKDGSGIGVRSRTNAGML